MSMDEPHGEKNGKVVPFAFRVQDSLGLGLLNFLGLEPTRVEPLGLHSKGSLLVLSANIRLG
jgi:hypothetical protein